MSDLDQLSAFINQNLVNQYYEQHHTHTYEQVQAQTLQPIATQPVQNEIVSHSQQLDPFKDAVTEDTIKRWIQKGSVTVSNYLGFSPNVSKDDVATMQTILTSKGYLYCLICNTYVKANKKSVSRHNKSKHDSKVDQAPAIGPQLTETPHTEAAYTEHIVVEPVETDSKKRKSDELESFEGVTINTVNRWKKSRKVDVECLLGMPDHAAEVDRVRGADLLARTGHFYCLICNAYLKANKKSITRHQSKNKKHLTGLAALEGDVYTHPTEPLVGIEIPENFLTMTPPAKGIRYTLISTCVMCIVRFIFIKTFIHSYTPTT